jgi:hypothetical protein
MKHSGSAMHTFPVLDQGQRVQEGAFPMPVGIIPHENN